MMVDVNVIECLVAAKPVWRLLERQGAVATPFQRFDWIAPWYRRVAATAGEKILTVVGRDQAGAPSFLWPFVFRPDAPVVIARFPGGTHSSINMGLWTRAAAAEITATALHAILCSAGRQYGIDAFELTRQPLEWRGMENPFARLPRQMTVDDVYGVTLPLGSREAVLGAVLTRDMRSRLRKKERKLEKFENYRYFRAATEDEVDRVLAAFL